MDKGIIYIASFFLVFGSAFAQSTIFNYSNSSVMTFPVNSSYSGTISLHSAYVAESYIVGKVGQNYYNRFVTLYGGSSYGNVSYVYFTYNVPFSNNNNQSDIAGTFSRSLGITVAINRGTVERYIGPDKPYVATVNQSTAIGIGNGYGFQGNSSAVIQAAFYNYSTTSEYMVVWAVTHLSLGKGNAYPGIYVDINNATVLGEFAYVPSGGSSDYGPGGYGTLGDFILLSQNSTNSAAQKQQSYPEPSWIYLIAALVVVIIIAIVLLKTERTQR